MRFVAIPCLIRALLCAAPVLLTFALGADAQTVMVSRAPNGQPGDNHSTAPALSADGRFVAFETGATNFPDFQSHAMHKIYVWDRETRAMELVSKSTLGLAANGASWQPRVSADGRYVAFASCANNLGSVPPVMEPACGWLGTQDRQIYLRDRATRQTRSVSAGAVGLWTDYSMSDDARYVAFRATHPTVGTVTYLSDTVTGNVTIATRDSAGTIVEGNGLVSGDGRTFVYADASGRVYVLDIASDTLRVPAYPLPAYIRDLLQGVSGDGRFVVFSSGLPYAADDTNHEMDIYVFDTLLGTYQRASRSREGIEANGMSLVASISGDGRHVLFTSEATNLIDEGSDTNGRPDLFVHDRELGTTFRVNVAPDGTQAEAVGAYTNVTLAINANGSYIAFSEFASNMVAPGIDTNGLSDVFLRAMQDPDGDGLPTSWESKMGLDPARADGVDGASGDPDGDGQSNAAEFAAGTHPRGTHKRYLAEGATGPLFDVRLAVFNPNDTPAVATIQYQRMGAGPVSEILTVAPRRRYTINPEALPGMSSTAFASLVESDVPLVVDRTMSWDSATGYGSHAETAVPEASKEWYVAEGATHSGFELYYLLQNPNAAPVSVEIEYLLPSGSTRTSTHTVQAHRRENIYVNGVEGLSRTDVSAVFRVVDGGPIIVERAMYQSRGRFLEAGHASAAVTAPRTSWFFAEGAVGDLFDTYLLLANPNAFPVTVDVTYLLTGGGTIARAVEVAAKARMTLFVDRDIAHEVGGVASVSFTVVARDAAGIIAERAMWWPGDYRAWLEGHNAFGTSTGTKWAVAEAAVGGTREEATYILIANTSTHAGLAAMTVCFDDGTTIMKFVELPPQSRTTVPLAPADAIHDTAIGAYFRERVSDKATFFSVIVESIGEMPAEIVVERAMYSSDGQPASFWPYWPAGTSAVATRLR